MRTRVSGTNCLIILGRSLRPDGRSRRRLLGRSLRVGWVGRGNEVADRHLALFAVRVELFFLFLSFLHAFCALLSDAPYLYSTLVHLLFVFLLPGYNSRIFPACSGPSIYSISLARKASSHPTSIHPWLNIHHLHTRPDHILPARRTHPDPGPDRRIRLGRIPDREEEGNSARRNLAQSPDCMDPSVPVGVKWGERKGSSDRRIGLSARHEHGLNTWSAG